jgi:predicted phosphodiesterase
MVLFGHTHSFCVRLEGGILMVNPGHLKVEDKRGEATFAMLDINNRNVDVKILNMKETVRSHSSFQL